MSRPIFKKPNLIWIFGDQHRGQALGWKLDPNLSTPNLDRMAQMGLASTSAVSGYPLCCPYRGALITGRYPHLIVPGHEFQLPEDQLTVANVFKAHGYQTSYIGKWHLGGFKEKDGRAAFHIIPEKMRGGFDQWVGYENNNSQWDCWVHGGEGDQAFHYRLPGYETDALTDLFIDQLETYTLQQAEGKSVPFFAVLSVQPPHNPYVAPEEWMQRHTPGQIQLRPNVPDIPQVLERARRSLAGYYAQIENLDWNVGRILHALERMGLTESTHVIFFSDHGDMHGSHGQFLKTSPWEESIRVPFIIYGKESVYTQHTGNLPLLVNHVDIAPTSLGLCEIPKPDWMQGFDYSPFRLGADRNVNPPDSAFLQVVIPTHHPDSIDRPWRGVVTLDGWKYVALEGQPWLLFNLNDDPFELRNLAFNSIYSSERRQLNDRLATWIADTEDQFTLPIL